MSYLVAQMKEHLLAGCESTQPQNNQLTTFSAPHDKGLSLDCAIQAITDSDNSGILSRVIYHFPTRVPASLEDVFRYEAILNQRLMNSRVFIVQDLDGDQGYYLRMDTVIHGPVERTQIAALLDDVTKDVAVLLTYFDHPMAQKVISLEAHSARRQSRRIEEMAF